MPKFYLINDVGPGFDGVLIEAQELEGSEAVEVLRFIDPEVMSGDRQLSTPVTPGSILMDSAFLTEVSDPGLREFDSKSPYGLFQLEGRMQRGDIEVAYSQYERALQVNVTELQDGKYGRDPVRKTLLAVNYTKDFDKVKSLIETSLKDQDDTDQLVFKLEELRDNG